MTEPQVGNSHHCKHFETAAFAAEWQGFVFVRGHAAGEASVARLCEDLSSNGPEIALSQAKGAFSLAIHDKRTATTHYCTDPFGLMRVFVAGGGVSGDLIGLIRALGRNESAIDREGLASFVRYGFYNLGRTIDGRVRVLGGSELAQQRSGCATLLTQKSSNGPNGRTFDFDAYIADVAKAVASERISLDLTGGFDTRLLAAACRHAGIPVEECATMGTDAHADMRIARLVAGQMKLPHMPSTHNAGDFEHRLPELLRLTSGQIGLATFDHAFQFARARHARGITLALSGVGGEVWKDFWWLQDLPFLTGRPNFNRLYATRIEPRAPDASSIAPTFHGAFEDVREAYLEAMTERFAAAERTVAYDSAYAYLRMPFVAAPWVTGSIKSGLPTFCPLLDQEGISASMHMRKRDRLFMAWHRETITRFAPELARLRTTDGLSARTGVSALADIPYYAGDKSMRLAQKVAQRFGIADIINRQLFDQNAFRTKPVHELAKSALAILSRFGVVRTAIDPANLSFPMFDRILTAGLLLAETT